MYVACLVFLLMWCGYAWAWREGSAAKGDEPEIELKAPLLRQTCSTDEVPCVDDCSFLCVERDTECVGGLCQTKEHLQDIACNEKTGGVRVMAMEPTPHWTCICSDARFYGGEACDRLNPDVCERGTFFYLHRSRHVCVCPTPYRLLRIDSKPHCVEERMLNFFDPATMSTKLVG